ncbi:DNA-binding transcriptional regulator, ArsR family [Paenibacillus sp. UNCCL117]|uniref:ArsR/SmtB family transcription factor n=1 Tax=unclassified Paenibacillus TaxID=185978 RepID=UPI000890FD2F|nr:MULTISPECIES: metalloregulator ArsR/SmtB family transcription factor [unclassified Paenibacillus]SDE64530.1 DNA-binding transcriptional regulator, ArsR family [Paenibacillus sp. cl123]SFW70555.1 DNA-binding transcriptional regulator, ArsR family [Paenibacillus sp. UNCCL117]
MDTHIFSALAEPHRLSIVELLRGGPLTVGEIAERLDLRQPQASKHLRILLEAGLLEVEAVANRRNYRLRREPFRELDAWLKPYLNLWNERFDNLDIYLQKLQAKNHPPDSHS